MKVKPMIFNTEMVKALLDGRKVQTRRPVKPQPAPEQNWRGWIIESTDRKNEGCASWADGEGALMLNSVYSKPPAMTGDLIYVRERMRIHAIKGQVGVGVIAARAKYVADGDISDTIPWPSRAKEKPVLGKCLSNGGLREFSRLILKVTAVRVERVQDISLADCIAEGFAGGHGSIPGYMYSATPKEHFTAAWQEIYRDSWERNDWVWVIDFEVIRQNVDDYLKSQENAQ